MTKVFDFLSVKSPGKRMELLEKFLQFWHGRRRNEYGEPEKRLALLDLPKPLERFYQFAGRWPKREPRYASDWIYCEGGYHHLLGVDQLRWTDDGYLEFYQEYQGDWTMLTKPGAANPPVWIRGVWDGCPDSLCDLEDPRTKIEIKLADYLVSNVLLVSLMQSPANDFGTNVFNDYFEVHRDEFTKIWEMPQLDLPLVAGEIYQCGEFIALRKYGQTSFHTNTYHGHHALFRILAERIDG